MDPISPPTSSSESIKNTWEFKELSSFAFYQTIRPGHATDAPVHTQGEITILPSNRPAREKGIWVETEISAHDSKLAESFRPKWSSNDLVIENLSRALCRNPHQTQEDCRVTVKVTIYISHKLSLDYFLLKTQSLTVNIPDGIPVGRRTEVEISAPSTPLYISSVAPVPPLNIHALSTSLNTISGPVRGDFRLSDSLVIHTTSGSIDINLDLVPSKSDSATPARLDVKSNSGSIAIHTRTISTPAQIPARDYSSTISSSSGSIAASLVHGTFTQLFSHSGRIQASLYPHGDATDRSDLYAKTQSGSQEIKVHPSLTSATAPLRKFFADYNGISGSLDISYPAQWEGTVDGSTVSGSIGAVWPGLRVIRAGNGAGNHTFKAVKGTGEGLLKFKAISGSVRLRGEESAALARPVEVDDTVSSGMDMETETLRGEEPPSVARPVEVDNDAVSSDAETETLVGDDQQALLTPQSEAGDEWMSVQ
ncbi:MAG: hypothetical protein LQ346_008892 [Caloplaca aetnensis]|nr:MAG: hypothetical protein LQ346_008892 [Caloplaca aetnensis]